MASTSVASPIVVTGEGDGPDGERDGHQSGRQLGRVHHAADEHRPHGAGISLVSRLPSANGYGWNNSDITATWSCSDGLSGVANPSVSETLAIEGAGQSLTGRCEDRAGNSAASAVGNLSLDKTPPSVSASAAPPPNAAGWNNTNVAVTFTATDVLSGVDGATASEVVFSTDGMNLGATRSFSDRAGNLTTRSVNGVNLDKTPPTLAYGAQAPAPNGAGWNNTDVSVPFTAADNLSGVKSTSIPSPLVLVSEGPAVAGAVTVVDIADNVATFASSPVRIDKTAPAVACVATPGDLWPANHKLVPVSVSLTVTDALSGQSVAYAVTEARSSEPDDGLGDGDTAGDIQGVAVDADVLKGSLRSERAGGGDGRVYTIVYRAIDDAGNSTLRPRQSWCRTIRGRLRPGSSGREGDPRRIHYTEN